MEQQRNLQKIHNYIKIANTYHLYVNVYFFLKNYAFNKMLTLKLPPGEEKPLNQKMNYFLQELHKSHWDNKMMTKAEYDKFLTFYYDQIKVESADLNTTYICRDLLEVMNCFGKLDDYVVQRFDYFDRKIAYLIENPNACPQLNPSPNPNPNVNLKANPNDIPVNVNPIPNSNSNTLPITKPIVNPNINANLNPNIININEPSNFQQEQSQPPNKLENINEPLMPPPFKEPNEPEEAKPMDLIQNIHIDQSNKEYIPVYFDSSIKFSADILEQQLVKQKIIEQLALLADDLDSHEIEESKNHIETVIYYLRHILNK